MGCKFFSGRIFFCMRLLSFQGGRYFLKGGGGLFKEMNTFFGVV